VAKTKLKHTPYWYWGLIVLDAAALAWGWMYPVKLTLFFLLQLVAVWYFDSRPDDWRWVIGAGLIGPVVEMVAIWGGAWTYTAPFKFGLPIWLVVVYANAGLLLRRLAERKR